jgi:hypothetical protein
VFRSGDADALRQSTTPVLIPAITRQSLGTRLDQGRQQGVHPLAEPEIGATGIDDEILFSRK